MENVNQQNMTLKFKNNPYQYTRAVRFRAVPEKQSDCFKQKMPSEKPEASLSELANLLLNAHKKLESFFIASKSENGEVSFNRKISINKTWLKNWHKDRFYLDIKKDDNRDGKYALEDLKKTCSDLNDRLENWRKLADEFQKYSKQPQNLKFRRSDVANSISGLLNRNMLAYFSDFLVEAHTSDASIDEKNKNLKDVLDRVSDELKTAEVAYLSSQSEGVEIAKASFNYYIVNKNPKISKDTLEETKKKLEEPSFSNIKTKKGCYEWRAQNGFEFTFKTDQEREWLKEYFSRNDIKTDDNVKLSLDKTYDIMKAFRAEQKSVFYELTSHIPANQGSSYYVKNNNYLLKDYKFSYEKLNMQGINSEFSLFQFVDKIIEKRGKKEKFTGEHEYGKFIDLTEKIQDEGNKNKRGLFLFGKDCFFKEYGKFCDNYRRVAQLRGMHIAQIKGIEKEIQESKETSYWSFIYLEKNSKQLWLVPKKNRQSAKKFIDGKRGEEKQETDSAYLCCFESLTMRALNKLWFPDQSSFVKCMPGYLQRLRFEAKQSKTRDDSDKIKKEKLLKFLTELMRSPYLKETLHLDNFKLDSICSAKNLEDFEKKLEDACYHVKKISFKENEKQDFLDKFDVTVLDITSYDLEERNQNTHQTPASENKHHTDLWKAFWENKSEVKGFELGKIRLNPEVKIRYRKADTDIKKYFEEKEFPSSFKHRKLNDEFTTVFTLAINAGKRYDDLAFCKPEDILSKIEDFNEKLNSEMAQKPIWKYGIDRGNIELATLCIAKFDQNDTYKENGKTILNPSFPNSEQDIKCYELKKDKYNYSVKVTDKKGREKHRKAIVNLSYFDVENSELFEKKSVTCLDLTTSKVIKGKIVTNGDVMTYLKLKKTVAKRRLHDLYRTGKIRKDSKLMWSCKDDGKDSEKRAEGVLNVNTISEGERTVYWHSKEYESIFSKECVKGSLDLYMAELILHDLYRTGKISKDSDLVWIEKKNGSDPKPSEIVLNINTSEGKESVYWHECEKAISMERVKNRLGSYIRNVENNDHTPTVLQINHLRDAITSNMVGVICHLQKTYPGFVILENLRKTIIDLHFFDHNENISRRLETALYNKLQALGLVPPHIKNIIELREKRKKGLNQFGIIFFVSEENTSKECPYCEEKINGSSAAPDQKFRQHRFICGDEKPCGFDTYYFKDENARVENHSPAVDNASQRAEFETFKEIDDPDKVAAYNVAKKKDKEELTKK